MYLADPGRSIGRFAWIPNRFAPYVGAGGGAMWYRFRQEGDFIDFDTLKVFPDTFDSDGWTPTVHGVRGHRCILVRHASPCRSKAATNGHARR